MGISEFDVKIKWYSIKKNGNDYKENRKLKKLHMMRARRDIEPISWKYFQFIYWLDTPVYFIWLLI